MGKDRNPGRGGRNLTGPRSVVRWALVVFSLSGIALSAFLFAVFRPNWDHLAFPDGFYIPLVLMGACTVAAFATGNASVYYTASVLRALFFVACLYFVAGCGEIEMLLFSGILLDFSFSEPYPRNLAVTLVLAAAAILLRGLLMGLRGVPFPFWTPTQIGVAVPALLLAFLGCRLVFFREAAIDLQDKSAKLENSLVQMARALSEYQNYAATTREASANQERKRITRDIHDIVGYTLTNNIMLMEAARDMMQENPLGIPATIAAARANAEEGLARIRQAMYDLRLQETAYPVGVQAIHRLATIFQKATGITVRCEFGDVPWSFPEEVDSALHHLVQECLVNSFRHGKAGRILLLFRKTEGTVHVRVMDDGIGAPVIREGIGIRGMKERIGRLGGTLRVCGVEGGFLVEAFIPMRTESDGTTDPYSHL